MDLDVEDYCRWYLNSCHGKEINESELRERSLGTALDEWQSFPRQFKVGSKKHSFDVDQLETVSLYSFREWCNDRLRICQEMTVINEITYLDRQ